MTLRTKLPYLDILPTHFQRFDHGKEVQQDVPASWKLQADDRLLWECAQFGGIAEVVSCAVQGELNHATFKKVS